VKLRLDLQAEDHILEWATASTEGIGVRLPKDSEGFGRLRPSPIADHDEVLIAKIIELPFDLKL
jgi:hypothetical protein